MSTDTTTTPLIPSDIPTSNSSSTSTEPPKLNVKRHLTYFTRILKTYLPPHYTPLDSNRLSIAFFTISALDLLGLLETHTTAEERKGYADWIYHLQHPDGGFRGTSATDMGALRTDGNTAWDPANIPSTFFALNTLIILGDDLTRLERKECLQWLRRLQRPEGSFGETLGENGRIEGGLDSRFGYCATGIRWILRGNLEGPVDGVDDIDVDALVQCIRGAETYDGGISEAPFHEAHAGFTYCAIGALHFVDRLPSNLSAAATHVERSSRNGDARKDEKVRGIPDLSHTLHWLVSRQTATLSHEDSLDTYADETDTPATCHDAHSFVATPTPSLQAVYSSKTSHMTQQFREIQWAGFNGRCNKIADTCYSYWVIGALSLLGAANLVDQKANRWFLLDKAQHLVGGFGKQAGDTPDALHSYLGLAALAMSGEEGLKAFHPAMCISMDARQRVIDMPWRKALLEGKETADR